MKNWYEITSPLARNDRKKQRFAMTEKQVGKKVAKKKKGFNEN
jgi:hypothetical protein